MYTKTLYLTYVPAYFKKSCILNTERSGVEGIIG